MSIPPLTSAPRDSPLLIPAQVAEKFKDDVWCSNPPHVTSYITYPRSKTPSLVTRATYTSPICGFGWRFELREEFHCWTSLSNSQVQELVGETALVFRPHLCSSMPLSKIDASVKVFYPDAGDTDLACERMFSKVAVQISPFGVEHSFGTYSGPPQYKGKTHIQVTIAFNPLDGLSLPKSKINLYVVCTGGSRDSER